MRLSSYEIGRRPAQRAFLAVTGLLGSPINDVGKVSMRRAEFFGRPFMALAQLALRGRSGWSVGERELFAAVVSQANSCAFCIGTHGAIAGSALGIAVDESWRDGRFGARAMAAAEFVDALTTDPDRVGPELVAAARAAGVDDAALAEAVYVAFAFNTVNRVADALGFEHRSYRELRRDARFLRINGYRMPGFLLR
ncbi:carboxymuconolactone decarboxylase family protein [Nocardioides sp. NPDC006273]|uniref:carboxymuconolactone decarboxylase family protein n=1 Tax=Nocardioides sp. NPDC006273 TaxID=3155598 RepID=UPI0033ACAE7E